MPCVRQNDKPHQSSHDKVVHQHKDNHTREVLPCTVTYCVTVEILLVHSKLKSPKIQTIPHNLQFHCEFLKILSTWLYTKFAYSLPLSKSKYTTNKENNKNQLYTVNETVYIRSYYCLSRPLNSPSYKNKSGYTKYETTVYHSWGGSSPLCLKYIIRVNFYNF